MKVAHIKGAYEYNARPATRRYYELTNKAMFHNAVVGKSTVYAKALFNDAMALCGHPHYKLSFRNWGDDAIEFLKLFVKES